VASGPGQKLPSPPPLYDWQRTEKVRKNKRPMIGQIMAVLLLSGDLPQVTYPVCTSVSSRKVGGGAASLGSCEDYTQHKQERGCPGQAWNPKGCLLLTPQTQAHCWLQHHPDPWSALDLQSPPPQPQSLWGGLYHQGSQSRPHKAQDKEWGTSRSQCDCFRPLEARVSPYRPQTALTVWHSPGWTIPREHS
jgi:hypothetical protein